MKASGAVVQTLRYDHTVAVGTTSWVQLDASLDQNVIGIEIFDSSGSLLEFGIGPAGSEARVFFLMPGGTTGYTPCILNAGMRLAVRAIDTATAAPAQMAINFYG